MSLLPDPMVSKEERLLALTAYGGLIFCCTPMVPVTIFCLKKETSQYLGFHGVQAIFFGLAALSVWLLLSGANMGLALVVNGLTVLDAFSKTQTVASMGGTAAVGVFNIFFTVVQLGVGFYWVALMIMAYQGKNHRIPYLANLVDRVRR